MGLDTTHDCWHGSYGAFMNWRKAIAKASGLPPLVLMEGFFTPSEVTSNPFFFTKELSDLSRGGIDDLMKLLPIKWECLEQRPLLMLLNHSDCEGSIECQHCGPIADDLEKVLPDIETDWVKERAAQFITGLRCAAIAGEDVGFH